MSTSRPGSGIRPDVSRYLPMVQTGWSPRQAMAIPAQIALIFLSAWAVHIVTSFPLWNLLTGLALIVSSLLALIIVANATGRQISLWIGEKKSPLRQDLVRPWRGTPAYAWVGLGGVGDSLFAVTFLHSGHSVQALLEILAIMMIVTSIPLWLQHRAVTHRRAKAADFEAEDAVAFVLWWLALLAGVAALAINYHFGGTPVTPARHPAHAGTPIRPLVELILSCIGGLTVLFGAPALGLWFIRHWGAAKQAAAKTADNAKEGDK